MERMLLTILGGAGAWPRVDQPCSGYLLEQDGFTLLIDPGYGTFAALTAERRADEIDAVFVSHAHPDHCADLNPLLRARALGEVEAPDLPVYAGAGVLDRVLGLDPVEAVAQAAIVHPLEDAQSLRLNEWTIQVAALPHHGPNLGLKVSDGSRLFVYTGDSGSGAEREAFTEGADLLLAEATFVDEVPAEHAGQLSSIRDVGRSAAAQEAGQLVLTHLWPEVPWPSATEAIGRRCPASAVLAAPGQRFQL